MDKKSLQKLILLVAAGGDGSRLFNASRVKLWQTSSKQPQRIPLGGRGICILTAPLPYTTPDNSQVTFLDIILGQISNLQTEAGFLLPTAIIAGPNNYHALRERLTQIQKKGKFELELIQQGSKPVYSPEGEPFFWEDGQALLAPDGTAGCLQALESTTWFEAQVSAGKEFVFVWFANDIGPGRFIDEWVANFARSELPVQWISDDRGHAALKTYGEASDPSQRASLAEKLEDAPAAYLFRTGPMKELLKLTAEHAVHKAIPFLKPDQTFQVGIKQERFLSDIIRISALTRSRSNEKAAAEKNQTPAVRSRGAEKGLELLQNALKTLESGTTEGIISTDIGEKPVGEFLIDSYKVFQIEHGAFGIVYFCEDQENGERVAVKTFTDEIRWGYPQAVRRFWQEAYAWLQLPDHPYITRANGVEEVDGRLHLFLEYLEAGSLRRRLEKKVFSVAEAVKTAAQVCAGLEALHAHGLIHCDIKPENILFGSDGSAKITDLGLAQVVAESVSFPVGGTRGYLAPEQAAPAGKITARVDSYSLGVVLFEMLTGHLPEGGEEFVRRSNPETPPRLELLISRCLSLRPEERPPSGELKSELIRLFEMITGVPLALLDAPAQTDTTARSILAKVNGLEVLDRPQDALQACEMYLRTFPGERNFIFTKARLLYRLARYPECIHACLQLMQHPLDTPDSLDTKTDQLMEMAGVWLGTVDKPSEQWLILGQVASMIIGSSRLGQDYADLALHANPQDFGAWLLKAQCLYNLGEFEKALECYRKAVKSDDPRKRALASSEMRRCQTILDGKALTYFRLEKMNSTGNNLLERGDYPQALRFFREAHQLAPDDTQALKGLGLSLMELGQAEPALAYLERVTQADPQDADGWYNLACAHLFLTHFDRAREYNEKALALDEQLYKAWNNQGVCFLNEGDVQRARACFERALKINPSSEKAREGVNECDKKSAANPAAQAEGAVEFWSNKGTSFLEQGLLSEALSCLQTALKLDPAHAMLWYNVGYVLWMLGQHHAALEHCQKALEIDPKLVHAWNIRGNALDDLGYRPEAQKSYEEAIRLDPDYYEAWNGKGLCLQAAGQYKQALKCFEKACSIKRDYGRGWFNQGGVLADMGKEKEAIAAYDRALVINPHHKGAAAARGLVYFKMKKYQAAKESFELAIGTDPMNAENWNNLGGAHAQLGELGEAINCYRRALALQPDLEIARRNLERIERLSRGIFR